MSLNHTATWLNGNLSTNMIHFSGSVTTISTTLNGPGGASGNGFPVPFTGLIRSMTIWDGSNLHSVSSDFQIAVGDRISVDCTHEGGSSFTVYLNLNGIAMQLFLNGLPENSTYYCTLELLLKENS